jgi:hypothetical protein
MSTSTTPRVQVPQWHLKNIGGVVPERRFVSIAGAAEFCAVSKQTIWRRIRDGDITVYYLGPTARIDLNEIEAAMVPAGKGDAHAAA